MFFYTEQKPIKKFCTGALIPVLQGSQGMQTELLEIFSPAHQHKKIQKGILFFSTSPGYHTYSGCHQFNVQPGTKTKNHPNSHL